MDTENLVKMANNIAHFFSAEPDANLAVNGVVDHLSRFWETRMRKAIIQHHKAGGAGLSELAGAAVARLAAEHDSLVQTGDG